MKSLLKRMFPSYRASEAILGRMDYLDWHIGRVEAQLASLDYKNEYLFWLSNKMMEETDDEERIRLFQSMPPAKGILRQFQLADRFIVQQLRLVCEENDIQLFPVGGTLLGAVRHQGFIPWDDDVDFGIMRDDLAKLFDSVTRKNDLSLHYYYNYHDGYRLLKLKINGLDSAYVDVFVFDRISLNHQNPSERFSQLMEESIRFQNEMKKQIKALGLNVCQTKPVVNDVLDRCLLSLEEEIISKIQGDDQKDTICLGFSENPEFVKMNGLFKRESFFPLKKDALKFEGLSFNGLNHQEEYLKRLYDDYWTLPKELRFKHSSETVVEFQKEIQAYTELGIISE